MTNEEDFQRRLNRVSHDWQTRLVFADWLYERGDPRAEGYRVLGLLRKRPLKFKVKYIPHKHRLFRWYTFDLDDTEESRRYSSSEHHLPFAWWEMIAFDEWKTRREAEDAAALAFVDVPEKFKRIICPALFCST